MPAIKTTTSRTQRFLEKEELYEYNPILFFIDVVRILSNFLNNELFFKGRMVVDDRFVSPVTTEVLKMVIEKFFFSLFFLL